jgi:hypothetical protein
VVEGIVHHLHITGGIVNCMTEDLANQIEVNESLGTF